MRTFAALLLALSPWIATAATVERVWTAWRPADYFESLSEHFSGTEYNGREIVVRTRATERAGYYYLVRLDFGDAGAPALKAQLEIVPPGASTPTAHSWDLPATGRSSQVYQIGVTGKDWPGKKATPLAWRLRFTDATGTVVAVRESFLWATPTEEKR